MNLLRFKAPALIELVTPNAAPGIFSTPLTRDIKVVNAFGFASAADESSAFQIFAVSQGTRYNISKVMPLRSNETSYMVEIDSAWTTLRTGWVLGVEVFGATQANIYIWTIPLPAPNR
jgi:hypothetical protein